MDFLQFVVFLAIDNNNILWYSVGEIKIQKKIEHLC